MIIENKKEKSSHPADGAHGPDQFSPCSCWSNVPVAWDLSTGLVLAWDLSTGLVLACNLSTELVLASQGWGNEPLKKWYFNFQSQFLSQKKSYI